MPNEQTNIEQESNVETTVEETSSNIETNTEETSSKVETSIHWVKANGKMTTSLSPGIQAVIRELSPSNVGNITQFITWLLQEYQAKTIENTSLQENQDDLNKKLSIAIKELEELEASKLEDAVLAPLPTAEKVDTTTAPKQTAIAAKKSRSFLEILSGV